MATYDIDWDFIAEREGGSFLKGYHPSDKSGVTIATGVDLKEKDRSFFEHLGVPEHIINKLEPFFGLSGMEAKANANKLVLAEGEDTILNSAIKMYFAEEVAKTYEKYSNGKLFSDLTREQQTVLASVGFQHGTYFLRKDKTPMNFIKQAGQGDWTAVENNLRNFGDNFNTRRNLEADYLIKKKSSIFDIAKYNIQPYARGINDGIADVKEEVVETAQEVKQTGIEIADNVADNTMEFVGKASDAISSGVETTREFIGETVENIQEYSEQSEQNVQQVQQLIKDTQQVDKDEKQELKDYEVKSAKEFISNLEEPQLWNLDYAKPYDKEDLEAIKDQQLKIKQELKSKYNWKESTFAAYESETLEANIYKQFNKEKLAPDPNFTLTQELLDELADGLPDDFRDEFAHAHSLEHAQQIRQQLLAHLELEDKIYAQGQVSGTALRLMAAFTDPGAWAAIIATDGVLAPYVVVAKSARAYRILRRAGAGAVSIGAIESYLASQRPDLDVDDVMHGVMTGAFLGGLFGIRTPKVKTDNFTKQFKDGMDEGNTKLIRDDGGFTPNPNSNSPRIPGPNNPNPVKANGERTFDWYDPQYDMALMTRKRPDGRFEVKMIENQSGKPDELIMEVRKDGTVEVRKCK